MSKYIFNNDTDILEFLEQLRENGIQIWGEGEKIRYRSKNRQLAPETLRILKMAKGQILDFFRMIEKNVIPLTSIQTAYVVGQTAGCELGNINAHYYIEYTIEAVVVAQGDKYHKELVAFYLGEYIAESEIEDYLKIHLPEYSIPNSINRLENFPLNANGKVDRRRLAEYQKIVMTFLILL